MNALIINSLLGNSTVSSKQNLFLNGDKNHQNLQVLSSRPGTALSAGGSKLSASHPRTRGTSGKKSWKWRASRQCLQCIQEVDVM